MDITGTYTFNADQETVWKLLMDPNAIAKAIPGVQEMMPIEGEANAWRAIAKLGIGSISGTYAGIVRMSDVEPPNRYRLSVSGEGQQSIISGTALLTLTFDAEHHQTVLNWDAHASVSGKLASIGQRVIKSTAGLIGKMFFGALAKQLPDSETVSSTAEES